jgi:hypothetical protein
LEASTTLANSKIVSKEAFTLAMLFAKMPAKLPATARNYPETVSPFEKHHLSHSSLF